MKRLCHFLIAWCVCCAMANISNAEVLFESGTLGTTGVSWSDGASRTFPIVSVSPHVFTGVRFHLDQPVLTTSVGGHFVSPSGGEFLGAIVALDDAMDFPNSGNLSTPDVLGRASLTFPTSSAEVFGNLEVSLQPGWYALVYGSGLFGVSGSGGAPANNSDIGNPTYIAFQPGSGVSWIDLATFVTDLRFVVEGSVIPEPSTLVLILLTSLTFVIRSQRTAR